MHVGMILSLLSYYITDVEESRIFGKSDAGQLWMQVYQTRTQSSPSIHSGRNASQQA